MTVNPICGREKCKYTVPHEHVQFLGTEKNGVRNTPGGSHDTDDGAEPAPFNDPYSPEAIAAKIQALDACNNADETPKWAQEIKDTLVQTQNGLRISIDSALTNTAKTAIDLTHMQVDFKTQDGVRMGVLAELLRRKPLTFWDLLIASIWADGVVLGVLLVLIALAFV